ncbi:hypothetical protein QYM36_005032 [Artemia franciscana]|uniref:RRM domain-containing protein n=1 Tax=Artemia franciscana TaxID=6661 RepID=A0AA88I410_ARTSF|nr:hypothetical protein QYM36_005032 [Artemia franciscana]
MFEYQTPGILQLISRTGSYSAPEEASTAVNKLDRFPSRPNHCLGVTVSIDNCRLFIGGLPKDKHREEIFDEISRVTEGVVDVICYPGIADKSKSQGFAFVEYESH